MSKKKRVAVRVRAARVGRESGGASRLRGGGQEVASAGIGSASIAEDALWQAIRSPLRLRILEAIRAAPGVDVRTLSELLKTSAPGLYYHINILLESGLIEGSEIAVAEGQRAAVGASKPRRGARGPAALAYRARTGGFPEGFFSRHERARHREEQLVRDLFDRGLSFAFKQPRDGGRHLLVRTETLTAQEAARIKGLFRQVEEVLDGARARRHAGSYLIAATHFVGCAFSSVADGELPDGPLEAR